ncbi:MAG: hypothetical protein ACK41C_12165 [Phenylobacterium sp.]|uniref:hypothetical protein n=1 Tax=Phenylobacterium sp. TaxID=1871053 RepID=UPI00391D7497
MSSAPPTFWPAADAAWRLDRSLIAAIHRELTRPLPKRITKLQRHDLLQRRLSELGDRFGYDSKIEVATGYRRRRYSGRFDVMWSPREGGSLPIVFEVDSCWRHESLLKLGRVSEEALKLWVYYGMRSAPPEPIEPGFRRLNILRIEPWLLGMKDSQRLRHLEPGPWPEVLYPRRAEGGTLRFEPTATFMRSGPIV